MLPGELTAVYVTIGEPPFLVEAVKGTVADVPLLVTIPIVGAAGTVGADALNAFDTDLIELEDFKERIVM
jgi:hypothetical protein